MDLTPSWGDSKERCQQVPLGCPDSRVHLGRQQAASLGTACGFTLWCAELSGKPLNEDQKESFQLYGTLLQELVNGQGLHLSNPSWVLLCFGHWGIWGHAALRVLLKST